MRPGPDARIRAVHLRLPSLDRGVTSFLWAVGLAFYLWVGMLAIGVSQGVAVVIALLAFFGIFLFVRLRGDERP